MSAESTLRAILKKLQSEEIPISHENDVKNAMRKAGLNPAMEDCSEEQYQKIKSQFKKPNPDENTENKALTATEESAPAPSRNTPSREEEELEYTLLTPDVLRQIRLIGQDLFHITKTVTIQSMREGVRQGVNEFDFDKAVQNYSYSDRKKKRDEVVKNVLAEVFVTGK